jgi:hypothetical protein
MKKKIFLLAIILLISPVGFGQTIYKISTAGVPFETLITNIGSNNATIIVDSPIILINTITIVEKNISLEFYNGNIITIGTGKTLTLNCPIKAGIFQIFNCVGTGKTDGLPLIDQCYPHWWQSNSIGQFDSWTNAIQRAVNFYPKVYFPSREELKGYHIDNSINLDLSRHNKVSYHLCGEGGGSYFETDPFPSFNDFVFKCINVPSDGFSNGLIFEKLSFYCKNGIQINGGNNTLSLTFADEKYPILNVKINNCIFKQNSNPNSSNDGVAINFRKVFDSEISNNIIDGFGYGVKFDGVDISSIRDNRIQNFYKYAIFDRSFRNSTIHIGSQNSIFHNDLLFYNGNNNQNAFIKTNSNHILIRDNYLENQGSGKLWAFIDCSLLDLPLNSEFGTENIYSAHIDITGNRCDSSNTTTNFLYYINENFKSLNLIEIPTYNSSQNLKAESTFAKMIKPTGSGLYTGTPVNKIPIIVDGQTTIDKLINMKNCFSFKNWENFSSSAVFPNNSNGDIIIDSSTISKISDISGTCTPPTFNPRSFTLGAAGSQPNCSNPNPHIFIRFHQYTDLPGEFSDIFNNMIIKLKVRNLPTQGYTTEVTDDLYLRIDELINGTWTTKYTNSSIDIKNGVGYSIIKIAIPTTVIFDASKTYVLAISSKSYYVKEFKEIIFENSGTVVTDSTQKQASQTNTGLKEIIESEISKEETVQTLTVKVDNPLNMSPNPAQSNLTIDIKQGDTIKSIEIYTESGSLIGDYTNKVNNNTIDISSLPNAVYIVKVVSITSSSKIIIKE